MKKIILIILILTCLKLYSLEKNDYYKIIDNVYKNKNYQTGIDALKKAIIKYPDEANFYSNLIFFCLHAKQIEPGYTYAVKAFQKFPEHEYTKNAYKWALAEMGWDSFNKKEYDKSLNYFDTADKIFPEDANILNGIGCSLRNLKRFPEAISILEKGYKIDPNHKYIPENLSWAYFEYGNSLFESDDIEKKKLSYNNFKKAFEIGNKNKVNIYTAYLYKLPQLKKFEEGLMILNEALKKFGNNDEVYKAGFWIYYNLSNNYKEQKKYIKQVEILKKLYEFSLKFNLIYKDDITFQHLALMNVYHNINQIISTICPYWKKYNTEQKKLSYEIFNEFKKDLNKDLAFILHNFLGSIYYRENKIKEAKIELDISYNTFINSKFGNKYKNQVVEIPFLLKGIFRISNKDSIHSITHMGLNKFCYDIYGSDINGREIKEGIDYNNAELNDYFGYGATIYSPVDGVVIDAEGNNSDDPAKPNFSSITPNGNYVFILSKNKIFNFYHLKKDSVLVKKGDKVKSGQPIGQLGNSSSTTPHLHFGVYSSDWLVSFPIVFTNYSKIINGKKIFTKKGMPGEKGKYELIYSD